jgi:hypothetical protein
MPKGLAFTGYILAFIGGIIMIITGGLGMLSVTLRLPSATALQTVGAFGRDFITLILGVIATIGARYCDYLGWGIGLIIIGLIGGDLGGVLVLVGGILGLVHRLYRPR